MKREPVISAPASDAAWQDESRRDPLIAIPEGLTGRWWVAHTKPRAEKALALDLRARGVFSYLPLFEKTTRSRASGRRSRSISPVFTGYVFMNAGEEGRRAALTTNRIVNLLPVTNQGELVGELRRVQQVLATRTEFDWAEALATGDWVRVIAGPLAGVEGVVGRWVSRVKLSLNVQMLSQSIVIELTRDMVEKIDRPAHAV